MLPPPRTASFVAPGTAPVLQSPTVDQVAVPVPVQLSTVGAASVTVTTPFVLDVADQKRFLRHLKKYWEPHRHRMAPEISERLNGYKASGALQVVAGRIQDIASRGGATQVRILSKCGGQRLLEVDRIISCIGIQESYTDSPRPLIRSLMETGLAQSNEVGIGFQTDGQGALLGAKRIPSSVFFTLGPPCRGDLFETTAVPEIRVQAASLARRLVGLTA